MANNSNLELALKIKALVEGAKNVEALADQVEGLIETGRKGGVPDITPELRSGAERTLGVVSALKTAIRALIVEEAVRRFVETNASLESISKSMEAVTGDSMRARREMDFVSAQANRMGIEIEAAARSYLTLAAATRGTHLEGEQTRVIWSAVAQRMAQLGASTDDVRGAMVQLAQGASKGRFELEDLKSIAERIPGFFKLAAEAMGVTTEQFFQLVSAGRVTADFLPLLAAKLGATGGEIDTFNANIARLKNSFTGLATAIGSTGIFDALSFTLRKLSETINLVVNSAKLMASVFQDEEARRKTREDYENAARALFGLGRAYAAAGEGAQTAGTQISEGMRKASLETAAAVGPARDLAEAYKRLEIDPETFISGVTTVERQTVEAFQRIAADPNVSGRALLTGLLSALDKVSKDAVPRLAVAWKQLSKADPFRDSKLSLDQAAAGMQAIQAKTAGIWPELDKTDKSAQKVVATYQQLIDKANQLRAGANQKPIDTSIEGQASATLDLIYAQERLLRLQTSGEPLDQVQAQAEAVRALSGRLTDQARAREAQNQAALIESQALEQAAAREAQQQSGLKQQIDATRGELQTLGKEADSLAAEERKIKISGDFDGLRQQMTELRAELARGITVPVTLAMPSGASVPAGGDVANTVRREALMRGAR